MSRPRTLREVVAGGLCSGCGLCESLAGRERVQMQMAANGFLRPRILAPLPAALERRLIAACPGATLRLPKEVEGDACQTHLPCGGRVAGARHAGEQSEPEGAVPISTHRASPTTRPLPSPPPQGRGKARDAIWGPWRWAGKAYARDAELRFRASSGGVLTALACHLLDAGEVDAVLHVAAQPDAALRNQARVSRSPAEVVAALGARYGPAAPLVEITGLLDRGWRLAVISKPCDIAGLANLARQDPRVARQVKVTLSFFCGGLPSLGIARRIVSSHGLAEQDVAALRWRGHGCPGATRIEARSGAVVEQSYDETWGDALNQEIQFRCKVCADAVGLAADLVVGDAWISADGYAHGEFEGWNAVIARSERGLQLLDAAERAGRLHREALPLRTLDRMQPHHVERRGSVLARLLALRLAGQPAPQVRDAGLLRAAWRGRRGFLGNFLGTLRRVRQGRNREDSGSEPG